MIRLSTLNKPRRAASSGKGRCVQEVPPNQRMIHLTLPFPPSVNGLYPSSQHHRGRHLSKEGTAFKRNVAMRIAGNTRPIIGDVYLSICLYRPRKSGDVSNYVKAIEDALKGFAFVDDKQVRRLTVERDDTDPANARAEVEVWPWAIAPAAVFVEAGK